MSGAVTSHPDDGILSNLGDAEQAAETIVAMALFREVDDVTLVDEHAASASGRPCGTCSARSASSA